MINYIKNFLKKSTIKEPEKEIIKRDFNIEEFNDWFKYEYDGYSGRKGAIGIFLRTSKLSFNIVEAYLKHIGQSTEYRKVSEHYEIINNDWRKKLREQNN